MRPTNSDPEAALQELRAALDEELHRLPEKYQAPLMLCYLEGKSHAEAARQLGWPLGTIKGRLARARELLGTRLARRGVALSVGSLTAALTESTASAGTVPIGLIASTVEVAIGFSVGKGTGAGGISARVAGLAEGAIRATVVNKGRASVIVLVAMSFLAVGAGLGAYHIFRAQPPAAEGVGPEKHEGGQRVEKKQGSTDRHGDPLPSGAVVRLGTERLVHPALEFMAFSPDGNQLASVDRDGTIRLWETSTGKESWVNHTTHFTSLSEMSPLAFSPDGKAIALGCFDLSVRVWQAGTGKLLYHVPAFPGQIVALCFSKDGKHLATGSANGWIHLCDPLNGQIVSKWKGGGWIFSLAFADNGKTLISVGNDGEPWPVKTIRLWETATGKERVHHQAKTYGYYPCVLSGDGAFLAAASDQGDAIHLWDPVSGKELGQMRGQDGKAVAYSFSPESSLLASSTSQGITKVWDAKNVRILHEIKSHTPGILKIALSRDGKVLASTGRSDDAIHLWNVAEAKELQAFVGHRSGPLIVSFSADGKTLATTSRDASSTQGLMPWSEWSLRQWDSESGQQLSVLRHDQGGEVHLATFSSDGALLATVTHAGILRLWDAKAAKELRQWKVPILETVMRSGGKITAKLPRPAISDLAFSPDNKTLAGVGEAQILLWDVANGKEIRQWQRPPGAILCRCLFTADSRNLIVVDWSDGAKMFLLNGSSGQEIQRFQDPQAWPPRPVRDFAHSLAISPDGKTLAAACGKDIHLWETASGQERGRFVGSSDFAFCLSFSPDGQLLACGGKPDAGIALWQLETGKLLQTFDGIRTRVTSLAFSPDGKKLASAGYANTVLIWRVKFSTSKKALDSMARSPLEMEKLWSDLVGGNGILAYRAIWEIASVPRLSVPFLKERFKSLSNADPQRIAKLIADLDDDQLEVREKATEELAVLGKAAEKPLRAALEDRPTAEVRIRVHGLLDRLGKSGSSSSDSAPLAGIRALEVLEKIATTEARKVIDEVAKGAPEALLTQEAKASLERLAKRSYILRIKE